VIGLPGEGYPRFQGPERPFAPAGGRPFPNRLR